MQVVPITYGSPEYEASLALREEFLRLAVGLELTEADTAGEVAQLHYGLFDDARQLVASAIGKPLPEEGTDVVQLRQVVVHEMQRRRGLGSLLIEGVESELAAHGFRHFVLFARVESAPFYEQCGYTRVGSSRVLLGIDHQRMEKRRER